MFQEIWKWDEDAKRLLFDRKHCSQTWEADGDVRVARLVDECAQWRRMYEAKSIECARLQRELEKRNG